MVGMSRRGAGRILRSVSSAAEPTPRLRATPPAGLARITRLGHAMLDRPVQVVAVSRTNAGVLAATPSDAVSVPVQVAQRLSTAEGVMTIDGPDGTTWVGAGIDAWGERMRVTICAPAGNDGGRTRATLTDLAALAGDVLRLDTAQQDAAGLRELLGTASHDLRNPLTVLRAGLETLALHSDDLPEGQTERIAELVVRQARRMATMIDGMLSLHGLEDDLTHEEIDLRTLARDAVEAGRLSHELVQLQLLGDLPANPVVVRGLPDSLARVLTNLVTNAAIHGGGHVWVGLDVHGREAVMSVADDGPGMPGNGALDTGQRAHRRGGHGLGLIIAARIIDGHDGSIGYRDREGGGTVVELTLPLAR